MGDEIYFHIHGFTDCFLFGQQLPRSSICLSSNYEYASSGNMRLLTRGYDTPQILQTTTHTELRV